jgi:predicted transcriptional regulator
MRKQPVLSQLGELETAVMEHLWSRGAGDVKSVYAALGKRRGITLNTIQSTLKRLFEKELLQRDKVSHAHVYVPRLSRDEYKRCLLEDVVQRVLQGEASVMAAAFVDLAERAGEGHLAELERLIAERRRARGRGAP